MTVSAKQGQHLTREQKAEIRYGHPGASDLALARKYGVRAATIRLVRSTGEWNHAARVAAQRVRDARTKAVYARVVPATQVREPRGQQYVNQVADITLRTADGHDIPQTMR